MDVSLRSALFLLAAASVAAGACGGNVVVDQSNVGSGGAGGSTTTSTTVGPTTTSTTVGPTTTSTTVSVSSSSSTTTSSTGGVGACSDNLDQKILLNSVIWQIGVKCAMTTGANPGADLMCIVAATGLSTGCANCLVTDTECAVQFCLTPCLNNPNGPACASCRTANCLSAFAACSGQSRELGALTCAGLLGGGPLTQPWVQGLAPADFTTNNAYSSYQSYSTCACNVCPQCRMDYCTGQATANVNCADCIVMACGSAEAQCAVN
jgi:hypothetical protein